MKLKFSIIIPHRGQPKLLQRLLRSIPQRDDTEIIVIEDKEGHGAGWARNKGLDKAKGEFLIFADSDDYFTEHFNDILNCVAQGECQADIIYFSATSIEEGTDKPSWRAARINWIMAQEPEQQEFLLRHTFTEPWCHIVRSKLVRENNIRFDETPILNDVHFSTHVGYHAENIAVIPQKGYCVCNRPDSVGKKKDAARLIAYSKVMAETNIFNRTHNIDRFHGRMMRPFFYCIVSSKIPTAIKCWKTIKGAGFTNNEILHQCLLYPKHVFHWMKRRHKYAAYA